MRPHWFVSLAVGISASGLLRAAMENYTLLAILTAHDLR